MRARRCCGVRAPCPVPSLCLLQRFDSGPALAEAGYRPHRIVSQAATLHHVHAGFLLSYIKGGPRWDGCLESSCLFALRALHCLVFPPSLPPFTSKHCSRLHCTAVTLATTTLTTMATTTLMFTFGPENAYMDTHSKSRVPKDQ